jgi:hypothetical protein
VLFALSVFPAPRAVASSIDRSTIARGIVREAPQWAATIARTDLRDILEVFVPRERPVFIAATTDFRRIAVAERELYDLVNQERRARKVDRLAWDERLAETARTHASDMYRRGYFGHDDLEGRSPGDRLRARKISFAVTGENLALAPTVGDAHNRLMGSERHRGHILGREFARLGIGVVYGRQGLLVVEEFAG